MASKGKPSKGRGLSDVLLVLESAVILTVVRLALTMIPFRHVSSYLGILNQISPEHSTPRNRWCALRVARGIHFTFLRLPWHSTCLVQAIAGMMMLKRRGESSTLYVGVGRNNETFGAHAWLRSGEIIVTGGDEMDKFKVLSSFMQPSRGMDSSRPESHA